MNELKQLERQRAEINERIDAIETAKDEEKSVTLVGRSFKYRNNYSCPKTDADYWWLYFRVTGYEGKRLTGYSFQRDVYGRLELDPNATAFNHLQGWEEVDGAEFIRARAAFLTELNEQAMK